MKDSDLEYDSKGDRRTLYSLRHTYATLRILSGIDYARLKVNMGTSMDMLHKHYDHLLPEMVADELAG